MQTVDPRKEFPRKFVPENADMGRWEDIEPIGQLLLSRVTDSPQELEQWLEDWSELERCVLEEGARRNIATTQQTDNPDFERAHLVFVERVEPKWKVLKDKLNRAYLKNPWRNALPVRYRLLDRSTETRVSIFRDANVPLQTEEQKLRQEYGKIAGRMTVKYQGEERTLQQMEKLLGEPDRVLREEAWRLLSQRRLQDRDSLEKLFDQLVQIRTRIAQNAGFPSYLEYAFPNMERFDYAPEDCLRFHRAVEMHFSPLLGRLAHNLQAQLGINTLRPWDMYLHWKAVDPLSRPPLRPFATTQELTSGCQEIFRRISPEFADWFGFILEKELLDLESRRAKRPGGYQSSLYERRWTFIFMNAVGTSEDVRVLLHEGGHAFNALSARDEKLAEYWHPPIEFAEVASQGMELLSMPHLDVFYPKSADLERARRQQLEDIVRVFPWFAIIDAFQHWIYTHPNHTRNERREMWRHTFHRFYRGLDWLGLEEYLDYLWHRQLHLFLHPFYYIEYGIAYLGALQVWLNSKKNYPQAVEQYRYALSLGGSRPLPELFEAAGAKFDFSEKTIAPLAKMLEEELEKLPL